MSLSPPPAFPVPTAAAAGNASYHIREDEDTGAVLVLIEYDGVTLPLWWSGNALRGWHSGAVIPEHLMLAAKAVATRLGVELRC